MMDSLETNETTAVEQPIEPIVEAESKTTEAPAEEKAEMPQSKDEVVAIECIDQGLLVFGASGDRLAVDTIYN